MNGEDSFITIVSENFNEIRRNFERGLCKIGYEWDEDLFIDVFLKCVEILKNRKLTKSGAIKYYWVSYLNTLRKYKVKSKQLINTDDLPEDIALYTPTYNKDVDIIFDIIMLAIREKFGDRIANAWKSHICQGKTYKELANEGFNDMKFNYEFKRIMKYIRKDLSKKDKTFAELWNYLKENRCDD